MNNNNRNVRINNNTNNNNGSNNNMFNFGGSNISINFNGSNQNGQISKYIIYNIYNNIYRPSTNHEFN
jgi:hypothetical protein